MRMAANPSLMEITEQPGQHNHEDEVVEVKKEKFRQNLFSSPKCKVLKV